jgi:hypothetical protein
MMTSQCNNRPGTRGFERASHAQNVALSDSPNAAMLVEQPVHWRAWREACSRSRPSPSSPSRTAPERSCLRLSERLQSFPRAAPQERRRLLRALRCVVSRSLLQNSVSHQPFERVCRESLARKGSVGYGTRRGTALAKTWRGGQMLRHGKSKVREPYKRAWLGSWDKARRGDCGRVLERQSVASRSAITVYPGGDIYASTSRSSRTSVGDTGGLRNCRVFTRTYPSRSTTTSV